MKKKILWAVALVLLVAAVVICSLRWNAWFGNVPEPEYVVPEGPQNIVLTVGENGDQDRTVSWRTRDSLPSWLYVENDSFAVSAHLVCTRSGRAYYYNYTLKGLQPGCYRYWVRSGKHVSDTCRFQITGPDSLRFVLFGDIQETELPNPFSEMVRRIDLTRYNFMAYVGDVVERPRDDYWQAWFRSINGQQASVAQSPTTGNHEYLKGVVKHMDNRWNSVFVMPQNAPERFNGSAYYVDYQHLRMVFVNTDELQSPMDFFVARQWLRETLSGAGKKWRIVVMHHPVFSAGKGRQNLLIRWAFHGLLKEADLIISGHDHNYARRAAETPEADGWNTHASVYIETVSASKYYRGQQHSEDQYFLSETPVYEDIQVTANSIELETKKMADDRVIDHLSLSR